MNLDEAKQAILQLLRDKGKATNRQMIRAIGEDRELFEEVREELILDDLAKDKEGVGLVYIGPVFEPQEDSEAGQEAERAAEEPSLSLRADDDTPEKAHGIFISYGRADAEALAFGLEKDLSEKGHRVWLDKQQIRSGASWEEQIELAILGHEIFISLLSPHAVRRPDGVCLDEISMARYNKRKIVPVMVLQCRPPLGIYRLDRIDFQDWQNPARYKQAMNRLLAALERDVQVEGMDARIFSTLRPLDFGAEVSRLTRDFTGREWLFRELEEWLLNDKSRVFFITGDPGTGKSAIMAHLVHKHPQVAAYHFCISSLRDSLDPFRFVRSMASQLATQLEGYRAALEGVDLEDIIESDPGVLLRRLVADLLKGEQPDKPVLLLVDALDEAFQVESRSIAQVLQERMDDLPSWVRLVMSSRKEPEILDMFSRFEPHEIDAAREENLQDVAAYLERRFQEPKLAKILGRGGPSLEEVIALISKKGEGNFLYVTQAVSGIEAGQIDPRNPDAFPDGLVGIYQSFFQRVFPDGEVYDDFRPLLDVICAAREPLTSEQVAEFLELDTFDVEKELHKVSVFFPRRDSLYQAYHKSITDWLTGDVGHSLTYRINLKDGHRRIAESLLAAYKSGARDRFVLAHLPSHLIAAQMWDDLEVILTDLLFIGAKCAGGMTYELIADYKSALQTYPEAREERLKALEQEERIRKYTVDLVAYAKGEDDELDIIHSVKPWTHEDIKADTQRIKDCPTHLHRIQAFAHFVNLEQHSLTKYASHSLFTVQHANNHADSGPVSGAAEGIVASVSSVPLLLEAPACRAKYNPHPALSKTLEGHTDQVNGVSVTADGRMAVSGGNDRTLRVWDVETGECVKTFQGHTNFVQSVSVTADGRMAVSGGHATVRVWDIETGECIKTLKTFGEGYSGWIQSVSVTPDGRKAVSGDNDRTVRVWDIETGECVRTFKTFGGGYSCKVSSVNVTPDGRRAVSGSYATVQVWDIETGECVRAFKGHKGLVGSVSVTPDGRKAVSGDNDATLRVWDIETGECVKTFGKGHTVSVSSVSVTPDGRMAVSGGYDTVRVWDIETGECVRTFKGHTDFVNSVSVTPDGRMAVSGGKDATVRVWDIETGECVKTFEGHKPLVPRWGVSVTPDGRRAVSGYDDRTLRVWDMETGECVKTFKGHTGWIRSVTVTPDGRKAVSGGSDTVEVWDIETGECVKTFKISVKGHEWIRSVTVTPDGRKAVSGGDDRTLRVWDIETGECVRTFKGHKRSVSSVTVTPDGRRAVSGGSDTVEVWDIETGESVKTFKGHTSFVQSVSVTPDGRRAVSGGDDRTLRVWDIETGECFRTLKGHTDSVFSVGVTPGGRMAVSGDNDRTLRVWDIETGECLSIYRGTDAISSISEIKALGRFVYREDYGRVVCLLLHNHTTGLPVLTPVRLWLRGQNQDPDHWDENVTTMCQACGKRFPVSNEILDIITSINRNANLFPDQSPCLELPDEAWDEPKLISECPLCHKPLKFNPFIVDNRDRY
ncbi:MAG: TIR domain-containing protein [Thermodesulfobacteriota bacterium]|nr:TIR domain-containing protein [Thermodesulfobacteriota bacterium]